MKNAFIYLFAFLVWNTAAGTLLLLLDPLIGVVLALGLTALFLWGYLLRRPLEMSAPRRWVTLRLRPLSGDRLRWALLGVPVLLVLAYAVGDVYMRIVPVPPEALNPFEAIMGTGGGRFAINVLAIAVAPIIEEFTFRGLIQSTLIRRYGVARGIAGAAALFALVHLLPWVFPLHFFLGLAFGFAVYATRSIWTGVVLHAANNAAAMLGTALSGGETEATPTLWEIGVTTDLWISVVLLIASSFVAAWAVRGMLATRRRTLLGST